MDIEPEVCIHKFIILSPGNRIRICGFLLQNRPKPTAYKILRTVKNNTTQHARATCCVPRGTSMHLTRTHVDVWRRVYMWQCKSPYIDAGHCIC